jgi:two-component system NtrC family sensor kinase
MPLNTNATIHTQRQPALQAASNAGSEGIVLSDLFDANPVATFVINTQHVITHWNCACEHVLGKSAVTMVGSRLQWMSFYAAERPVLADLIVDGSEAAAIERHYAGKYRASTLVPGAVEVDDFFPHLGPHGRWLHLTAAPLRGTQGTLIGAIETVEDITERRVAENALRAAHENLEFLVAERTRQLTDANLKMAEDIRHQQLADAELRQRNSELTELNEKLSMTQAQLVQSEKLASIGQLAAGVAHEINNPIGYIFSNLATLKSYMGNLFEMLQAYRRAEGTLAPAAADDLREIRERIELDFLLDDIPSLMDESRDGIIRVRNIVRDLKDFSRIDPALEWQWANLRQGIESTLNIVNNEVKYVADLALEFAALPEIECLPSQINQVILNLVVNAAHAIGPERGKITIRTGLCDDGQNVWIEVSDNGSGIPKDVLPRIFDPFFTTKPVGKGTGLGLSLSYRIIEKHRGTFNVVSEPGVGSTFRITLPIRQNEHEAKP